MNRKLAEVAKKFWHAVATVASSAAKDWYKDRTFELGAALAYYGVFALAPTLVIAIALAGRLFGREAARGEVIRIVGRIAGNEVAEAITESLTYVHLSRSGGFATVLGAGAIVLGTTALFRQLQSALNAVWDVRPKPGRGIRATVRNRLLAFLLVLSVGGILIVALAVQTAASFVSGFLANSTLLDTFRVWEIASRLLSLVLLTLIFAMIYKLLPDVTIAWSIVWGGAVTTAVLIALGNYGIGLYLGHRAISSAYGAAGSLVIVMIWVYYSSQVLLFGAELTQKLSKYRGEPIRPAPYAVRAWRRSSSQDELRARGEAPGGQE